MKFLSLSLVLSGLLVTAACATSAGTGDAGGAGGQASSSVTPKPSGGLPPAMRPNQMQPDSRAVDLKPTRWTNVESSERQLTIFFTTVGRPGCNVLGRVDVEETPQTVTVTVLLGRLPGIDCGGPQPQLAAPATTVVTLREPVGGRRVQDGAGAGTT